MWILRKSHPISLGPPMLTLMQRTLVASSVVAVIAVGSSCGQQAPPTGGASPAVASEAYAPGLGELMTFQQMRHTKLWLAGQARNWELAAYELDELEEGFDDIIKFHP